MDSTKPRTSAAPVVRSYQDFEPSSEWVRDQNSDTLLIHLPGFKKEQIKVQIDLHRNLKINGQSPLNGGSNRWIRFRKDFRIPETLGIKGIRAKFENGVLSVILPKLGTSRPQQELKPAAAVAAEEKPTTLQKAAETGSSSEEPEDTETAAEDRKITPKVKEQEKVHDDRPEEATDAAPGNEDKEQLAQTGGAAVGRRRGKASCYGVGGMVLETSRKKSMQQVVIVAVGVVSLGLLMYLTYKSIKGRVVSEISNY